jgi:hypothetical protein
MDIGHEPAWTAFKRGILAIFSRMPADGEIGSKAAQQADA